MEEKEIDISRECYYLAIQALCKGGYLNEVSMLVVSYSFHLMQVIVATSYNE